MNTYETKFNKFIKFIKTKFNQIQFRIVTIFILLMCAAAIAIIYLNYVENEAAVTKTSLTTTRQIGLGVVENLNSIIDGIQTVTTSTTALIQKPTDISGENQPLINYLLSILVQNPLVATVHICTVTGNLISASNLTLINQQQYRFNSTKNLPQGVRYVIETIVRTNNTAIETRSYLDTSYNVMGSEQTPTPPNDQRTKPWYTEVAGWPKSIWTDPYTIFSNTQGISFATPVIIDNQLAAVVGTDLALNSLSTFIADTVVGKTGKVFILNKLGEIILPETISGTMPYIIEQGYNIYNTTNQKEIVLHETDASYIVEVFNFPLDVTTEWTIMTAVPLGDFFDPILQSNLHSIQIGFFILLLATLLIYLAAGRISKPIRQLAEEVEKIKRFDFSEFTPTPSNIYEVSLLSYSIQTMRKAFSSFTKYVPKEIVQKLLQEEHELATGGERRNMTILFSDIENFTTIAEKLTVEEVTKILTEYFELFTRIILEEEGTIDKYIGDSIMALWNAPNFVANHAEKACLSCLNFIAYNKTNRSKNPFLKENTRFGINTGDAIVGNIGTTERISYTAIGTSVNTASRFQTLNKTYKTLIIIGETVKESLSPRFITRPLDLLAVKGRDQPIQIFELMGIESGEPKACLLTKDQINLAKQFTEAFNLFHKGKLEEAKTIFKTLSTQYPKDEPTKIYLQRLP
jgi:adenylate cyclase